MHIRRRASPCRVLQPAAAAGLAELNVLDVELPRVVADGELGVTAAGNGRMCRLSLLHRLEAAA